MKEISITYEKPSAQDYVSLRQRCGMGNKDIARSRIALENSLFTACIYNEDKLIAFGRVVGDGGITYVVSDIMVDQDYRRKGFADKIMNAIDQFLEENTFDDSYVCLIANAPADHLYHKYKFEYLPENKCGMLRKQG
jgi:GNAT superfamily N-acetyltransferase